MAIQTSAETVDLQKVLEENQEKLPRTIPGYVEFGLSKFTASHHSYDNTYTLYMQYKYRSKKGAYRVKREELGEFSEKIRQQYTKSLHKLHNLLKKVFGHPPAEISIVRCDIGYYTTAESPFYNIVDVQYELSVKV